MRSRSEAESWSGREKALETVIRLTPTWSAIVCRVTLATPHLLTGVTDGCGASAGGAVGRRDAVGGAMQDRGQTGAGAREAGTACRRRLLGGDGRVGAGAEDLALGGGPDVEGDDGCSAHGGANRYWDGRLLYRYSNAGFCTGQAPDASISRGAARERRAAGRARPGGAGRR